MKRWIVLLIIATASLSLSGCSMCCGPYDFDYPNYGGKHQRVDPAYGRVGSIFSDPNAGFAGPSADSNLEPHPESNRNSGDSFDEDDFDDDLESIDPLKLKSPGPDLEQLPNPTADDSTASRFWKRQPLRPEHSWR